MGMGLERNGTVIANTAGKRLIRYVLMIVVIMVGQDIIGDAKRYTIYGSPGRKALLYRDYRELSATCNLAILGIV